MDTSSGSSRPERPVQALGKRELPNAIPRNRSRYASILSIENPKVLRLRY